MRIDLAGSFRLEGDAFSPIEDARLPSSVLSALQEKGIIDDPYFGDNEIGARKFLQGDVAYSRAFAYQAKPGEKVFLHLGRVDTLAEIFLNGEIVAKTSSMHREYWIPLPPLQSENRLQIRIHSPYEAIRKNREKGEWLTFAVTETGSTSVRKANCMFGWDWAADLADMGIYGPIEIVTTSLGRFLDFRQRQIFKEDGSVKLGITTHYEVLGEGKIIIELTSPDGMKEVREENLCERNQFFFTFHHPALWYPRGYGEQPLYHLVLRFVGEGEEQVEERDIGLRQIKVRTTEEEKGRDMSFYVNGTRIFLRGSTFLPPSIVVPYRNGEDVQRLLDIAAEGNQNCLRIWGGGYYPSDDFLSACDKMGFLLYEDLMFACGTYNTDDPAFLEEIKEETRGVLRRIRHHACLLLIAGNNECEDGVRGWGTHFAEQYVYLFQHILKDIVKQETDLFYLSSSPTSGEPYFSFPNDPNYLDKHSWNVWGQERPIEDYRLEEPRMLSEFGFGAYPSLKTLKAYLPKKEIHHGSKGLEGHQKAKGGNERIDRYIAARYPQTNNLQELIYLSQAEQAKALEVAATHCRAHHERCNGTLWWHFNDPYPGVSYGCVSYDFTLREIQYAMKRVYQDQIIGFDQDAGGKLRVFAANDGKKPFLGKAVLRYHHLEGDVYQEKEFPVSLSPFSDLTILSFEPEEKTAFVVEAGFSGKKTILHGRDWAEEKGAIVEALLFDEQGNLVSSSFHHEEKEKDLPYLNPDIRIEMVEPKKIKVTCAAFAEGVALFHGDSLLLGTDNFFSLFPGEEKTIELFEPVEVKDIHWLCMNVIGRSDE